MKSAKLDKNGEDGAVIPRPENLDKVEIYSDDRIAEFELEDEMTDEEWERVQEMLRWR